MLPTLSTVLAWGWQPEIRGLSSVAIIFVVLVGGTYLLIATNLGARLGFLVAFTGFFGWMFLMGIIWWIYGIGLQGRLPFWEGQEIVRDGNLAGGVYEVTQKAAVALPDLEGLTDEQAVEVGEIEGWKKLPSSNAGVGQAYASAAGIVAEEGVFDDTAAYTPTAVYAYGGETYPDWFFNFFHNPHYNLVQLSPLVLQNAEPGAPPPTPVIDAGQPNTYVLMLRDLGYRRRPAALITLGSGIAFGLGAMSLHRRDKLVAKNRGTALAKVG
jgi:hypothetical protein